jgi:hypothetical protein
MRGLSQDGLSEITGVSQPQISKRLSGAVAWTLEDLETFADSCHIPMTLFFENVPTTLRWLATFIEAHSCDPWAVTVVPDELRGLVATDNDGTAVA